MAEEKPKHGGHGGHGGEDGAVAVQVLLRCRALAEREITERTPQVITCNEALREVTLFQSTAGKPVSRTFRFDKVFGSDCSQERLFKQAITPIVDEVMDGFNCTIFAYGQTGTGKTYTMEGGPRESDDGRKLSSQAGVIPRSIKQIFDHIDASDSDSTVKVSFLELYNEELTDLLSFEEDNKKLRLLEDKSGVVVQGLDEMSVRTAAEIYQVLDRGTAKRRTAATLLNNRSSRSHSIFAITIHMKETTPEGEDVIKIGKLNLVDLAGSENISRSGAKDSRAREAGSINQSLLTLGRVITALVEHSGHVPYRDSKLTRLLRDSLGGRTKTCIIATIAPTVQCQEETISTLDYAHRAKNIRNRPELNQKISKTTMIKELATEIEKLKMDLQCTREKTGVYLSNERYEQNELERVQFREGLKQAKAELELAETTALATAAAETAAHELEVLQLSVALAERSSELSRAKQDLAVAQAAIQERQFVEASLRRAENSLACYAEQLAVELGACGQDITQLTGQLSQAREVQASDRSCLQRVAELCSERVEALGGALRGALAKQAARYSAVVADVELFRDQKQSDVRGLRQQVQALAKGVEALQEAAAQQLATLAQGVAAGQDQTLRQARGQAAEAGAAAQAAGQAAAAAMSAVQDALLAQGELLRGIASEQAQGATRAAEQLSRLQTAACDSLQGVVGAAGTVAVASRARQAQLQGLLTSFGKGFDEALQQQQAALVGQVAQLLQGFAVSQAAAAAAGVASVVAAVTSQGRDAEGEAEGLQRLAERGLKAVQEEQRALELSAKQARTALQAGLGQAGSAAAAAHLEALATQQTWESKAGAAAGLPQAHLQALEATLVSVSSSTATTATTLAQQLGASASSLCEGHTQVSQGLGVHQEQSAAFASTVVAHTQEAAQGLAGLAANHTEGLAALGGGVGQEVGGALQRAAPAAVQARLRPAPPSPSTARELVAPPEAVLLAQLRGARHDISQRGGDPSLAARLLLTPGMLAKGTLRPSSSLSPPGASHLRTSSGSGAARENAPPSSPPHAPATAPVGRSRIPGAGKGETATPAKGGISGRHTLLADRTNA